MAGRRIDNPAAVALVATALAALVTALLLGIILEGDDEQATDQPTPLTLAGEGTVPQVDLTGQPAPDFGYEQLSGGEQASFAEFRSGRPAVINFFASWCAPCVEEMPDLEDAYQQFGDRVAFLGLATNDRIDEARGLVERTGVTYETGRDPAGDIITAYSGVGMPTTVFIAADGTITTSHTGPISPQQLADRIESELLA